MELASILQDKGYRAQVKNSSTGKSYIASSAEGLKFTVHFYDCGTPGCRTLIYNLSLNFKDGIASDLANAWNAEKIYGRAYLDKDNDPHLDLVQPLKGGISADAMSATFSTWTRQIDAFAKHVGFRK